MTLNPQSSTTQWETASEKGRDLELSTESPCELQQPEPSPFSSKRTMYETEEVRLPTLPLWRHLWDWAVARGPLMRGASSILDNKGLRCAHPCPGVGREVHENRPFGSKIRILAST